ncbi:hypothetical protein LJY25_19110 [Hymenobacter sp. BT175]|nr:hypothetical protein [Hymenobacter translucens]MCC2548565.1 hypothetical protein [Hymenobacter translucens]
MRYLGELEKDGYLQKTGTSEAETEHQLIGSSRAGAQVQTLKRALWGHFF